MSQDIIDYKRAETTICVPEGTKEEECPITKLEFIPVLNQANLTINQTTIADITNNQTDTNQINNHNGMSN